MPYQLVCLALLRSNFHFFRLKVAQIGVLHPLEGLGDVFDAFDFEEKRLGQVDSALQWRVETRRAKQKLFNRASEDVAIHILRTKLPLLGGERSEFVLADQTHVESLA
eukprot:CAMPEP_0185612508 /NCGR_PEP_ID=MMETSP0436-20130131/22011_1 /TAXON_ID=626734 ORGANISM="Favella taraikaensis, Strain Fe Narragansett Bay" /NCGR_SAMPLE_ID=MMETSP0436 /ASSEMBLY_ACC=CAM_ASM_000390 /LENGTH=107 /DNA_ID=CAMNT_0028245951 /DNA_START=497 /DNA_END=820 /DNA_ORIENTATION=+